MRTALLSCGHNRNNIRNVELGQEAHCFKCNTDGAVIAVSDTYTVTCTDCIFHRDYDTRPNAERGMTLHLKKQGSTGHKLNLYYGNTLITERKIELPLYIDTSLI